MVILACFEALWINEGEPDLKSKGTVDEGVRAQLAIKRQEHQDLDQAIQALMALSPLDQLQVRRLKKKKLMLKDEIKSLEDQLFPDIIA